MSIPIQYLRGLCVKSMLELRVRVSLHDGATADRLRGPGGEKIVAKVVGLLLEELADHAAPTPPDHRHSHTLAAVKRALPRRPRGEKVGA